MSYQNNYQNQQNEGEIAFDGVISKDSQEFVTLRPGEYQFRVKDLEKSRSKGEGKLPPTNMVIVTCEINSDQGFASIREYLLLHSSTEWKLSQFFGSIGQKKKGEPLRMDWNKVIGATGKCKVTNRENNGNTYNQIAEFILPDDYDSNQSTGSGWQAGAF